MKVRWCCLWGKIFLLGEKWFLLDSDSSGIYKLQGIALRQAMCWWKETSLSSRRSGNWDQEATALCKAPCHTKGSAKELLAVPEVTIRPEASACHKGRTFPGSWVVILPVLVVKASHRALTCDAPGRCSVWATALGFHSHSQCGHFTKIVEMWWSFK